MADINLSINSTHTLTSSDSWVSFLRQLANQIAAGKISVRGEDCSIETARDLDGRTTGKFKVTMLYYDKKQDDTIDPSVINLEIQDGTLGSSDSLKPEK